jgi:DNA adenine methylase
MSDLLATPFLKWAGGKTQLLAEILPRLPERMTTYVEPFIGGGAVFFSLASQRRFDDAVIADRNPVLVEAYQTVRDEVGALIDALEEHARFGTDEEYFYAIRAKDVTRMDKVQRTARLIYLNKTCFNGLYRVNRKGQFNVPFGRYAKPRILDEHNLKACAQVLKNVTILESDFEGVARLARRGDGIYFDPPYVPLSATSSFTSYDKHPFGPKEHARLVEVYKGCCERGAVAVLSNSDCPITRELYADLKVMTVEATRAINSKGASRGRINEVLVAGLGRPQPNLQQTWDSAVPAATERFLKGRRKAAS